jgi:N6-adenosine-specific RNA methylase IME4
MSRPTTIAPPRLKFHPLANVFPLLQGAAFDGFTADIAAHGVREQITLYQGKILDGRNRYRASIVAGVPCPMRIYDGDDPAGFVVSENLVRRHLGPSERAMVGARMVTLQWGQRADYAEGQICTSAAAKLVGVSERSVKSARVVLEHGIAALQQAVDSGRIAVHEAASAARYSPDAQADFVASGKQFIVWDSNRRRIDAAAALAATTHALPIGQQRWPLILADPPWQYECPGGISANRRIENHYPTMTLDEICALEVGALAMDDCVLFLWITAPLLYLAFRVLAAWGFEYKTNLAWDKEIIGTGRFVRSQHEHLLLATRGNPPKPPTAVVPASVIRERRREHSRKPESAYAIIEAMYPDLPKLELFARHRRPGWTSHGNQLPPLHEAAE